MTVSMNSIKFWWKKTTLRLLNMRIVQKVL